MINILAALFFYIFPILIGRPITQFLCKIPLYKKRNEVALPDAMPQKTYLPYPFISYFAVGAATIFAALILTYYTSILIDPYVMFAPIMQITVAVLAFILLPLNFLFRPTDLAIKKNALPVIASLLIAGVSYFIWQMNSPYPLNWDIYEHQTLTNTILQGTYGFVPSLITDTFGFDGYSTLFHTLLATAQMFLSVSTFSFWTTLSFIHVALVVMASYFMGKEISNRKEVGIISALFGGLVFDSSISFTNMFLIPQTFTAVLFIFFYVQLLAIIKRQEKIPVYFLIFNLIFILLNHYIVGFVAAGLYLITYLYFAFPRLVRTNPYKKQIVEALLFITFIGILLSSSISLSFLNKGEAGAFTLTLADKFNVMRQSYGYLLLLIIPITISLILKRKREIELFIGMLATLLLGLILTQLPYVVKFFVLEKYFIGAIAALGIYLMLSRLNRAFRYAAYVLLSVTLIVILAVNSYTWKSILTYQETLTNVSTDEIKASEFLKKNYANSQVLVISDPATQYVLEGLGTVNTQGGAYMDTSVRETLDEAGKSKTVQELASHLSHVDDKITPYSETRLLALSGRYFAWQKSTSKDKLNLNYNIWQPTALTLQDKKDIDLIISSPTYFKPVFSNDSMVIVEIKSNQNGLK